MDGLGNVRIKGVSGKTYAFRAYPMDTKFEGFGAVYFITSRNSNPDGRISHSRIFCGQTRNISVLPDNVQRTVCFTANHANCICILPNADEDARIEIENDIHQNYRLLCNC